MKDVFLILYRVSYTEYRLFIYLPIGMRKGRLNHDGFGPLYRLIIHAAVVFGPSRKHLSFSHVRTNARMAQKPSHWDFFAPVLAMDDELRVKQERIT